MMQAVQLVKDFVEEQLSGNWENLKNFDFRTLRNSEKYGCPDRYFDCDDTNIMRAIYVVLWGDIMPYMNMNNFGYQRQYRGDTMNTFHTMFGRAMQDLPGYYAGLEKYNPTPEFRVRVLHFSNLYSNIGNYVVLPNYYANKTTLNCHRGTNEWHDFFDRFLMELHKALSNAEDADKTLLELLEVNKFCLDKFRGDEGWRKMIDCLWLHDYCDQNGLPRQIFAMNYHWMNEKDPEQYFRDAELYLEKTEQIICNRAEKMIDSLQQKISAASLQ